MLGIEKDEVIGIGDGHNDTPLLQACGLKVS
jgi:phosphoserine phosphatase